MVQGCGKARETDSWRLDVIGQGSGQPGGPIVGVLVPIDGVNATERGSQMRDSVGQRCLHSQPYGTPPRSRLFCASSGVVARPLRQATGHQVLSAAVLVGLSAAAFLLDILHLRNIAVGHPKRKRC